MDNSENLIEVHHLLGHRELELTYIFTDNECIALGRSRDTDGNGFVTYTEWSECGRVNFG